MKSTTTKLISVLSVLMVVALLCIGVCAKQIYTPDGTAANVTARGSLYGYKVDDYIRLAYSTTYASGSVDYMVSLNTTLYAKGSHPGSANGVASNGVSAQSEQVVMTASDNVTSISSSHSATVYASTTTSIPLLGLSMSVDDID